MAVSDAVEFRVIASAERDELEEALAAGAGGATWMTTITRVKARKLLDALRREDARLLAALEERDTYAAELDAALAILETYREVLGALRGDNDPDAVIGHHGPHGGRGPDDGSDEEGESLGASTR